jgi:hypothetical protein
MNNPWVKACAVLVAFFIPVILLKIMGYIVGYEIDPPILMYWGASFGTVLSVAVAGIIVLISL